LIQRSWLLLFPNYHCTADHRCYTQAIIVVVLAINDKHTLPVKHANTIKGFAQKKGIDFDEIFSHVVKMTSIRTILSLVAVEDLHLEQLDVKTTFLHGDLEEEIYMQQP
jgi:hypothetical protein